jgi:ribosomal-protein-alanine N-acetyltransferase
VVRTERLVLRPWSRADVDSLAKHADNRAIWLNLRDRFPHPYTRADAESWVDLCSAQTGEPTNLAIAFEGEAVGAIGLEPQADVHRLTAEIGYWLGEPFWGRGLATEALFAMTAHAFARFPFERLHAAVFDWNCASARVLEKAGYAFEGRLKRSIFKDGRMCDALLYARLRPR